GCNIELDEITQEQVLVGIRQSLQVRTSVLVEEVRDFLSAPRAKSVPPAEELAEFLRDTGRNLGHIYGRKVGRGKGRRPGQAFVTWTYLLAQSGIEDHLLELFEED